MMRRLVSDSWFLLGLFSSIMRELANITHDGPKWILLDGDIDPMWIESLNTVMDDNKVPRGKGDAQAIPHHLGSQSPRRIWKSQSHTRAGPK